MALQLFFRNLNKLTRGNHEVFVRKFSSSAESHQAGGMALWKKLSIFGAIPCVLIMTMKTVVELQGHGHGERPEFIPYDHLRIRNKRFPWGDGQRSLFHNPHSNPLPTGYED